MSAAEKRSRSAIEVSRIRILPLDLRVRTERAVQARADSRNSHRSGAWSTRSRNRALAHEPTALVRQRQIRRRTTSMINWCRYSASAITSHKTCSAGSRRRRTLAVPAWHRSPAQAITAEDDAQDGQSRPSHASAAYAAGGSIASSLRLAAPHRVYNCTLTRNKNAVQLLTERHCRHGGIGAGPYN